MRDYLEAAILVVNLFQVVAVEDRPLAHEGVELREDGGLVDDLRSHLSRICFLADFKKNCCAGQIWWLNLQRRS